MFRHNSPIAFTLLALASLAAQGQPGSTASSASPKKKVQLHLVGSAEVLSDRLRLTPARPQQVGAAWFAPKQQVAAGFVAEFQFQLTQQGGLGPGADGFAFVLQNQGLNAIAGRGSAGGFALGDGWRDPAKPGIPRSIAVFFDTYRNSDGDDPSDNYVAICTNGTMPQMRWPPRRLGVGRKLGVRLKDKRVHKARISFDPPMMTVSLDDREPVIRVPVDLSPVVDPAGFAYIGFTASTGNGWENHDVLHWSYTPGTPDVSSGLFVVQSDIQFLKTNCLEGRNLCTPGEAVLEQKGPESYHVILPANLEWGASIPNPAGRSVELTNIRGTICETARNGDSVMCAGPAGFPPGSGEQIASVLLDPASKPGALITKTENGRTWFSVNGRKGRQFSENQGYFEFDAQLR